MTWRIWGLRFWQWCSCGFHSSGTCSCVRRKSYSSILKAVRSSKRLTEPWWWSITFVEKVRIPLSCDTVSCLRCLVSSTRRISTDLRFSQRCCWEFKSPGMWCHVKWVGLNMLKVLKPCGSSRTTHPMTKHRIPGTHDTYPLCHNLLCGMTVWLGMCWAVNFISFSQNI